MMDLSEQHAAIRRFLLGQASEESAERIEELIFSDPDFAEQVRIVEEELINYSRAGELSPEERALFELKYLASPAGRRLVEYENTFNDFVRAKSEARRLTDNSAALNASSAPEDETNLPPRHEEPRKESRLLRLYSRLTARPALVYGLITTLILLSAVSIWLQSGRPGSDTARAERAAAELELARLNTGDAVTAQGAEVTVGTLMPAERGGGSMPRISVADRQRGLIMFRLNLPQRTSSRYRALFIDDRRNELFAVSNLSARDTTDGPQLWLRAPARYFVGGDYQIILGRALKDGSFAQEAAFPFRIIESR